MADDEKDKLVSLDSSLQAVTGRRKDRGSADGRGKAGYTSDIATGCTGDDLTGGDRWVCVVHHKTGLAVVSQTLVVKPFYRRISHASNAAADDRGPLERRNLTLFDGPRWIDLFTAEKRMDSGLASVSHYRVAWGYRRRRLPSPSSLETRAERKVRRSIQDALARSKQLLLLNPDRSSSQASYASDMIIDRVYNPSPSPCYRPTIILLGTERPEPLLDRLELLLAGASFRMTEHELATELPLGRDVESLLDLLEDEIAIVLQSRTKRGQLSKPQILLARDLAHLQVGTEAFELESGPDDVCQDTVRLRSLSSERWTSKMISPRDQA